jgi:hypothetical protein
LFVWGQTQAPYQRRVPLFSLPSDGDLGDIVLLVRIFKFFKAGAANDKEDSIYLKGDGVQKPKQNKTNFCVVFI